MHAQPLTFFHSLGSCVGASFFLPLSLSPLCPQTPEELDDSDFETEDFDVRSRTSVQTEDDQLIAGQSARVSCPQVLMEHFFATLSKVFNRKKPLSRY